jgi:hypothetical protein
MKRGPMIVALLALSLGLLMIRAQAQVRRFVPVTDAILQTGPLTAKHLTQDRVFGTFKRV